MKKFIIFFVISISLFANEDIEKEFLKTLNEVSEIATAKKLNLEKTPATVTVIRRDFIEKSGAKTLIDIIKFIPGIEISKSSSGKTQIIVRGIKSDYRDKIKLLINGADVTNNLYSNQFYYYNFPASLIKRVEFTKSPDSILYGSNAFLGVINIITFEEGDENLFTLYKSDKNYDQISFFQKFDINEFYLLMDGYYSSSKPFLKSPQTVKIDLWQHNYSVFREETSANTLEKNIGFGVTLKKEAHKLSYRYQSYKKGDFFGISRVTPYKDDKKVDLTHQFLIYNYENFIKHNIKIETNIGLKQYIWDGEFRVYPADLNPTADPNRDLIVGAYIKEREFFANLILKYLTKKHNITFLTQYKYAKPYDFYYLQYLATQSPKKFTQENNFIKEGIYRKIYSIALKDMIILKDFLSLDFGLRADHYSDFGNNLSYKGGFVYNFTQKDTIKLLYSHSFRAPSWIELYSKSAAEFNGNENLNPEKISLVEIQYLKKITPKDIFKFNFYTGKIKDNIDRFYDKTTGKRVYENLGDLDIKGVEASYTKIFNKNRFYLSVSKNDNRSDFNEYLGAREILVKSYLELIFDKLSSFTLLNYGSKIKTPPTIEDVDPFFSLDQIFSLNYKDFYITFGIKNLTNHKNYFWIQPTDIIMGRYMFVPIEAKVPSIGREYFISFKKSW